MLQFHEHRLEAIYLITSGSGTDYVMELARVLETFTTGIRLTRQGGTFLSIGTVNPRLSVSK